MFKEDRGARGLKKSDRGETGKRQCHEQKQGQIVGPHKPG